MNKRMSPPVEPILAQRSRRGVMGRNNNTVVRLMSSKTQLSGYSAYLTSL